MACCGHGCRASKYLLGALQGMQVLAGANDEQSGVLHWILVLPQHVRGTHWVLAILGLYMFVCVYALRVSHGCVVARLCCCTVVCCSKVDHLVIIGCFGCGCSFLWCACASSNGSIHAVYEHNTCCRGLWLGLQCTAACRCCSRVWLGFAVHCIPSGFVAASVLIKPNAFCWQYASALCPVSTLLSLSYVVFIFVAVCTPAVGGVALFSVVGLFFAGVHTPAVAPLFVVGHTDCS